MTTMRLHTLLATTALALSMTFVPHAAQSATYNVNALTGDDTRPCFDSTNAATPRRTIKKGVECAFAGDTVSVSPGTYAESVESKRDGTAAAPIVLRASDAGDAIVRPTAGGDEGFFVAHSYITVDGFKVKGGTTGMKIGPHDGGGGPVVGVLIENNVVSNNTVEGIKVTNGLNVEIAFNKIANNETNGISYSGNGSVIHGNSVSGNGQFGIYVKDGAGHDVYDNVAQNNGTSPDDDLKILGTTLAQTYHVHCATGDDTRTGPQARSAATPWRTIKRALLAAGAGDTIVALGGTPAQPVICNETTIETRRDGAPGAPIAIQAATPGAVRISPPAGNGIVIAHSFYTLGGLVVSGAVFGVQVGPHESGDGLVSDITLNGLRVTGNSGGGIKFTNAVGGVVKHSVVSDNGGYGIAYTGVGANLFNNLVTGNGGGGNYGITIVSGGGHRVRSNTLYGNSDGGLRFGVDSLAVVSGIAANNIIAGSPIGIKEQGSGTFTLQYNDVVGNATDYDLGLSVKGPGSIAKDPGFVNAAAGDFRLGRVATGQPADSPCIDAGSDTSSATNLDGRTAFTDKLPDTGLVDLGYHGTPLFPTEGAVTLGSATITFNPGLGSDSFALTATLAPGAGSDGIRPGTNYAEVSFGSFVYSLPVSGFKSLGAGQWSYTGPQATGTFTRQANGSVVVSINAAGLNLAVSDQPIAIGIRIGDDFGSLQTKMTGSLKAP